MKKNAMKGRILVIISTLLMLVTCGLGYWMHRLTGYALYYHLYITSLLFGGTNLLFIFLKLLNRMPSKRFFKKVIKKLPMVLRVLCFAGYGLVIVFGSQSIIAFLKNPGGGSYPSVSNVVIFLILFVVLLVLEKLCGYSRENTLFVNAMLSNSQIFMKLLMLEAIIAAAATVFESLKFFLIQTYVGYVFTGVLLYYAVCILFSMIVLTIRKEFTTEPYLNIPIPFVKNDRKGQVGFVDYLETNTGISMRSLWSVKFVREIAPYVVVLSGLFLWLSTCVVQVESYQQAAVYRLGALQSETLKPGIHLTLPYPFDKVEIYDTEVLSKTTIGFRAEESADNIWTTNHQGEEYKLLLGSGDEVVSINLRLEYKISDLFEYLESSTTPEAILEALSYELVTAQTIHTDLTTLLSIDREAFSKTFMEELSVMLEEKSVGLEVMSVVLESIHPPKEIAAIYQEAVSAEIDAEASILEAETTAQILLAEAQVSYNEVVSLAKSESVQSIAEAKSNVAEFMASLESYKANKDSYTFQKYLSAVREAYGNANLVIISKDIDESALFFGNFSKDSSASKSNNVLEDNSSSEE